MLTTENLSQILGVSHRKIDRATQALSLIPRVGFSHKKFWNEEQIDRIKEYLGDGGQGPESRLFAEGQTGKC